MNDMLNTEDTKTVLQSIAAKKKDLLVARVKRSSGDNSSTNSMKFVRKDIARLFTRLNK